MDIQLSIQELKQVVEQYYAAGQLPSFLTGLLVGIVAVLVVIRIIRKMDKTYNLLQSQILEYKASTSALSSENYRLRSEVEEKERRNTELIGERNTYRMEAEAARTRLGDAALAAQDYQRQILSLENQIADLAFSVTGFSGQLRDISNTDGQFWTKKPTVPIHRFHHINERKCPIISVVNFKGGVGKTHITANLGASLARAGYRTLLIDLDHQGSLTQLVLNSQEDEMALQWVRR
jgi:FtsZ-binding cell division protein ZapB